MLRNPIALALGVVAITAAPTAHTQRRSAPRQLDAAQAVTLLAGSTLTQTPTPSRYLHRVTEMTMGSGVTARVETWAMAPDKVLNMVWFPGLGTSLTGFDGTTGWTMSPLLGPVLLDGAHTRDLVRGLTPRPVISRFAAASSADGAVVYATGKETLDGRAVNAFLVVNNADTNRIYVDAESGLLAAWRHVRPTKGRTDTTRITLLGDYKAVDGVMQPMTTTVRGKGGDFVSRIVTLDHDPIDSAKFAPPPAVRRLLADKP